MTNTHAWPAIYDGELLPDPDQLTETPDVEALQKELRRAGIEISAPDVELHDWDGTTASVTTYVRCTVGDHHVWGAGVARDRAEARTRALAQAYQRASTRSSASTK